jgi:hypothetical protein
MNLDPRVKFDIEAYILKNFHKINKLEVDKKTPLKKEYISHIGYRNNEITVFTDKMQKGINGYDWKDLLWMKALMVKYLKKKDKKLSQIKGNTDKVLFVL